MSSHCNERYAFVLLFGMGKNAEHETLAGATDAARITYNERRGEHAVHRSATGGN